MQDDKESNKPTQCELRAALSYDPSTGLFLRRFSYGWKRVGNFGARGYIQIAFRHKTYYAHHLAWVIMTGDWPLRQIDHVDRVRHNNRWVNLRLASLREQRGNQSLRSDNQSGVKGVGVSGKGRWEARIFKHNKAISLGTYPSMVEAAAAYAKAAREYFGEFANPAVAEGVILQ